MQTPKKKRNTEKNITVYFDKEADFLEVLFEKTEGYFKETENDAIMEKILTDNRVIGFSILNVSKITSEKPVELALSKQQLSHKANAQMLQLWAFYFYP